MTIKTLEEKILKGSLSMVAPDAEIDGKGTFTVVVTYTPLQNVWHGSKSVVTFGLIKILSHPC